jgi:hypothetical protein
MKWSGRALEKAWIIKFEGECFWSTYATYMTYVMHYTACIAEMQLEHVVLDVYCSLPSNACFPLSLWVWFLVVWLFHVFGSDIQWPCVSSWVNIHNTSYIHVHMYAWKPLISFFDIQALPESLFPTPRNLPSRWTSKGWPCITPWYDSFSQVNMVTCPLSNTGHGPRACAWLLRSHYDRSPCISTKRAKSIKYFKHWILYHNFSFLRFVQFVCVSINLLL